MHNPISAIVRPLLIMALFGTMVGCSTSSSTSAIPTGSTAALRSSAVSQQSGVVDATGQPHLKVACSLQVVAEADTVGALTGQGMAADSAIQTVIAAGGGDARSWTMLPLVIDQEIALQAHTTGADSDYVAGQVVAWTLQSCDKAGNPLLSDDQLHRLIDFMTSTDEQGLRSDISSLRRDLGSVPTTIMGSDPDTPITVTSLTELAGDSAATSVPLVSKSVMTGPQTSGSIPAADPTARSTLSSPYSSGTSNVLHCKGQTIIVVSDLGLLLGGDSGASLRTSDYPGSNYGTFATDCKDSGHVVIYYGPYETERAGWVARREMGIGRAAVVMLNNDFSSGDSHTISGGLCELLNEQGRPPKLSIDPTDGVQTSPWVFELVEFLVDQPGLHFPMAELGQTTMTADIDTAVKAYQASAGLQADGYVGPATWSHIVYQACGD